MENVAWALGSLVEFDSGPFQFEFLCLRYLDITRYLEIFCSTTGRSFWV